MIIQTIATLNLRRRAIYAITSTGKENKTAYTKKKPHEVGAFLFFNVSQVFATVVPKMLP
jgi:hypothetical protein